MPIFTMKKASGLSICDREGRSYEFRFPTENITDPAIIQLLLEAGATPREPPEKVEPKQKPEPPADSAHA